MRRIVAYETHIRHVCVPYISEDKIGQKGIVGYRKYLPVLIILRKFWEQYWREKNYRVE